MIVHLDSTEHHGLALLDKTDAVWVVVAPKWWDFATWLWWWFCPSDKKGYANLNTVNEKRIRARVIRVSHKHVRVYGVPQTVSAGATVEKD